MCVCVHTVLDDIIIVRILLVALCILGLDYFHYLLGFPLHVVCICTFLEVERSLGWVSGMVTSSAGAPI